MKSHPEVEESGDVVVKSECSYSRCVKVFYILVMGSIALYSAFAVLGLITYYVVCSGAEKCEFEEEKLGYILLFGIVTFATVGGLGVICWFICCRTKSLCCAGRK